MLRAPRHHRVVPLLLVAALLGGGTFARAEQPPTPDESRQALRLADPTLDITLVASEPLVAGPVALAWDEQLRLYVAEMTDYPIAPPSGRIKRLEDRDGDGRYDHASVFAEGLPYPNGVLPWAGGVLVTAAPDLLFLKDADGDGKADVRRVVLTGFGEGNQQLRVNSPTWGLDNWVYLANGRSGGVVRRPGDPSGRAVAIPRNDLRLQPESGAFEAVAGFSQFGLPRDDWGDRFPSWNTVPIRHVVLEERLFARSPSLADAPTVAEILDLSDGGRIYSLAPTQRRFNRETVAFFNATCGPTIYRGDLLGDGYEGHAFVCEPLTSVVHHRRLEPNGPTFIARRVEKEREFLASTHPWFRPVNLATGPDGALYVADFCRAWVEHPAFVPEALRNSVDFREGHDRGRIWRIAPKTAQSAKPVPKPADGELTALVAALADRNGWRRDTAQRLLVERRDNQAVQPLRTLAHESPSLLARVHALWTLEGLSALDVGSLRSGLRDKDAHVREQAARLAERRAAECAGDLAALADDPESRVRLRAAIALATLDNEAGRGALARIAMRDAESPWTAPAILSGLAEKPLDFLVTLATRQPAWLNSPTHAQALFLNRLAGLVGTRNDAKEMHELLHKIAGVESEAAAFALLQGLAQGQSRVPARRLTWTEPPPEPFREAVQGIDRVRTAAPAAARAEDRPAWVRLLAFDVLVETRSPAARDLILPLLEPSQPNPLQAAAARGIGRLGGPTLVAQVLEGWDRFAIATRRILLGSLVTTEPLATQLLEAVEKGTVPAVELDPNTREALKRLGDGRLQVRIATVLHETPAADRRAVLKRYEPALGLKSDPARGQTLFSRHCQTCHARNGQGAKVGPDLISAASRPGEDLLIAILDPGREAAPDGLGVIVLTTQGQTLTGLLAEETPAAVRLRRAEGVEDVVPRGEIEAIRPTGRSLMPDGLEQVLSLQEMADLIAFLRSPVAAPAP